MGFEPTRAEHIGLAVQRLNHSATSSLALPSRSYWSPTRVGSDVAYLLTQANDEDPNRD